ncbi:MAG: hypothetical protein IT287_09170 [Bdellovibrionaceae bacterium]|nr:hypothetical protein [Pseudobdellovibrionaceae bacterium]
MAFKVEVQQDVGGIMVHMHGAMDEHAVLNPIVSTTPIIVDLSGVTYINSVGVRLWIRWLQEVTKQAQVVLENCPVLFVKNMSSIRGMINKNTKVASFVVPYYDDKYSERKNILFVFGKDFFKDGSVKLPRVTNSNNDVIEPDIIEQTYFSFLKL